MRRPCVFALVIVLFVICCAAKRSAEDTFVVMRFDDAAKGLLIRSMPLNVALPSSYRMYKDQPSFGIWMWARPKAYAQLQKSGSIDSTEGVFQIRITTDVGYDLLRKTFLCGEDCGEATLAKSMESGGATDVSAEKYVVNDIPILIVHAKFAPPGAQPTRIHLAYIATLISTNVVLVSFREPLGNERFGTRAWQKLTEALLASGPLKKLELASESVPPSILRLPNDADEKHGRIEGDTYIAPGGRFTITKLPLASADTALDEQFAGDSFTVAFRDDFGSLRRVDGGKLASELASRTREEALKFVFDDVTMPAFRAVSPQSRVVLERFQPEVLGGLLVRVVTMPGGSTLLEMNEKGDQSRLDGTRAVVLFVNGNLVFQATAQDARLGGVEGGVSENTENLVANAVALAKSVHLPQ